MYPPYDRPLPWLPGPPPGRSPLGLVPARHGDRRGRGHRARPRPARHHPPRVARRAGHPPPAPEPIIIEAAKYARPLSVSLVALAVYLSTEYVNWYLYGWVLHGRRAAWLREQRWVQRGVESFARAPFVTVAVFAFTPLPFWAARGLAILKRYPLTPF